LGYGVKKPMKLPVTLFHLAALAVFSCQAQSPAATDATIQALLGEVRQLRLALERSAVVSPKIQTVLWRMQWQQDVVTRVSQELEGVKNMMEQPQPDMEANLRMAEQGMPPEQRKFIEEEIKRNKARVEEEKTRQRVRESELTTRLRAEQAKLDELGTRLDALERALEAPQPK
jgi:hypothetical protein